MDVVGMIVFALIIILVLSAIILPRLERQKTTGTSGDE